MADLKAFAEQLVNLSVKEVNELAQILKEEYGIEPAAAAVAVAAGPAAGAPAEEEKTNFDELRQTVYAEVRSIHTKRFPYNDFLYNINPEDYNTESGSKGEGEETKE